MDCGAATPDSHTNPRPSGDLVAHMLRLDPRASFFLHLPTADRIHALTAILDGPSGTHFRNQASRLITEALCVKRLVPEAYAEWRPLVRDAMLYFGSHLSTARLAPKIVQQIELPGDTPPEKRLLLLIATVPGLQKLGQVIARNRHLHPLVRRELTHLENGISDVTADEMRSVIIENLGQNLEHYAVKLERRIFREASVSAVLRFTWQNPETQRRERGVFKVMKPYVPLYFAEDMDLLGRLAKHLGSNHKQYGFAEHTLPETFNDVRRLLQHEVEFAREQTNLRKASHVYRSVPSVRIPRLIPQLCTSTITAMTEEHGEKITTAAVRQSHRRRTKIAEQLIDAVVAIPLLTPAGAGLFHADPHAGNLLYDKRTGTLTLLDWALTGQVRHDQRRQFAMLIAMMVLRDTQGLSHVIERLSLLDTNGSSRQRRIIHQEVGNFLRAQPLARMPRAVNVVDLLERIAWQGVRLPTSMVMLRKVLFTLDGILHEIAGSNISIEFPVLRRLLATWLQHPSRAGWPFSLRDWVAVYLSATLYGGRLALDGLQQLAA